MLRHDFPPFPPRRGVTARALLLGSLGCLTIAVGEPYGVLVLRGSPLAADFSAGAALFLFFVFALLLNPLFRLLRLVRLEPGELATVYIMMVVAAAIPSWGFTMNLIPLMGGFFYYATPENGWTSQILPHLPSWLVPTDQAATWKLFEGGAKGEGPPWGIWLNPLLAWRSLFILTLYFVTLCLLVMLRKQWMEREKLLYPLAILPLELSSPPGDSLLAPLLRNPLTWAGLRQVGRRAWGLPSPLEDGDELFSYRVAVFGSLGGAALCCVWLVAAGLNLITALVFLCSSLVIFVGLTRIISQTGLAYGRATVAAPIFTVNVLGSSAVGSAGLTALGLNFAWAADIRTLVMASAATGLKLARDTGLDSRRLGGAILLAILVTLAASAWIVLRLAYTYGGINLVGWQFIGLPGFAGGWITQNINNPQPTHWWHLGYAAIGLCLMALLTYVKGRFVGFPLHPIGMTLGLTHPIYYVWFSVMLAWLVKALILKYGGARVYLRLRPFFLGMTLGAFGSAGFWLLVDYCTGMSGNVFTLG